MKPKNCKDKTAKKSVVLNAILVKEVTDGVPKKEKILWRLLTTNTIDNIEKVSQIINW